MVDIILQLFGWLMIISFSYIAIKWEVKGRREKIRNRVMVNEKGIKIPQNIYREKGMKEDPDDLTYEEMEKYCESRGKVKRDKIKYISVQWKDIKSWKYSCIVYEEDGGKGLGSPYFTLETSAGKIICFQATKDVVKSFKKYIQESQIVSLENKYEIVRKTLFRIIQISVLAFVVYMIFESLR